GPGRPPARNTRGTARRRRATEKQGRDRSPDSGGNGAAPDSAGREGRGGSVSGYDPIACRGDLGPDAFAIDTGRTWLRLRRAGMNPRIVNLEDVPAQKRSHGEKFECEIAPVGARLESRKLGFNVTVVPPGKRAYPYHAHRGNEEMFFILEGEGSVRIAGATHRIRKGDFVSLPPGRDSAHQIVNDSAADLRYLAVSTMELPEVVEYPDSGKLAFLARTPGGRAPAPHS